VRFVLLCSSRGCGRFLYKTPPERRELPLDPVDPLLSALGRGIGDPCGLSETGGGSRLLVRDVFLAEYDRDFVKSQMGYKQFTLLFVAEKSGYCQANDLAYVTVHNHGDGNQVGFSDDDLLSHERGYPALVQMTGNPVTALVFTEEAVAGDVFTGSSRHELASATILGPTVRTLRPKATNSITPIGEAYDRQTLMFGDRGQAILSDLKVAVIGLGGGSLINEMVARLSVGHILAIDPELVEESNLSRLPGATRRDALGIFPNVQLPSFRRLVRRTVRSKVAVAERVARAAYPEVWFEAVRGDMMDQGVARRLLDCDFIFLATDTMQSRLLFNQLVHQYLIPGAQIGAKVPTGKGGGVGDVRVVVRPVMPDAGCLLCAGAISPAQLNREALSSEERQRYIDDPDVHEPSDITLNALGASQAVNDFLFMFTGLHEPKTQLRGRFQWARRREWEESKDKPQEECKHCGRGSKSVYARGDKRPLRTRTA
jgi:hypothetical protein